MLNRKKSTLDPFLRSYTKSIGMSMKDSLKYNRTFLEKSLKKIDTIDIWANSLQDNDSCTQLLQELVMDSFTSVVFSFSGLYKYANATLRSSLETSLKVAYFSKHPIEYGWWKKDKSWQSNVKNVWGTGYDYFKSIENVEVIDKSLKGSGLFKSGRYTIPRIYSDLSKYVHTGFNRRQMTGENYSPEFDRDFFRKWNNTYTEVMRKINLLFICIFNTEFVSLSSSDKLKILDVGIDSPRIKTTLLKLYEP